jgi:hypothetical protein
MLGDHNPTTIDMLGDPACYVGVTRNSSAATTS